MAEIKVKHDESETKHMVHRDDKHGGLKTTNRDLKYALAKKGSFSKSLAERHKERISAHKAKRGLKSKIASKMK